MNVYDILSAWPVESPLSAQAIPGGNNNLSFAVVTADTQYILRVYQNNGEPNRIRYEHALLTRLEQANLPFSVPAPIPALSGSTLLPVQDDPGQTFAALFQFIPGEHPSADNLAHQRLCGAALARLDQALGQVTLDAQAARPSFADIARIHPAVPDPLVMLEHLPLEPPQRAQIVRIVGDLQAALPRRYQSLPRQIVHRDFDAGNVLVEGDRVSGVLDFEFAGPDVRTYDLARSLSLFTVSPWSHADGWPRVATFATGYRSHLELTPAELDALPDMMRLYRTWSLIHREGRRREGRANEEDVVARANGLLRQEEWLQRRQGDFIQLLS